MPTRSSFRALHRIVRAACLTATFVALAPAARAAPGSAFIEHEGTIVVAPADSTETLTVRVRPSGWGRYRLRALVEHAPANADAPATLRVRCLDADAFVLTGDGPARPLGREWVELPLPSSISTQDSAAHWLPAAADPAHDTKVLFALRPGDFTFEFTVSSPGLRLARVVLVHERDGPHESALAPDLAPSPVGPPLPWQLSNAWPTEKLAAALLPVETWRPYPRLANRTAWEAVPATTRAAVLAQAEAELTQPWPALPATAFLDYKRTGRREAYQTLRTTRLARLTNWVMAECLENQGRFLEPIADALWSVCEETWWGVPAHLGDATGGLPLPEHPLIDLFSPETGSLLAWTSYLLGDRLDSISPRLRERVVYEIDRRLLTPFLARDDWNWLGFPARWVNNHNTSINHHLLACALLAEADPARRAALAARVLRSLDAFLHSQLPDGGCEEGPGYWLRATGALLESLELLDSATAGQSALLRDPLVRALARYLPAMQLGPDHFFNFGDADAVQSIPGALLHRLGPRLDEPTVTALGAYALARDKSAAAIPARAQTHPGRWLAAWFATPAPSPGPAPAPLPRDAWLPDSELFVARDAAGSTAGFAVAALGGHNAQSHNHNDVGSFVLYHDGTPVLIDAGREPYTAQTFDYTRRYELWFTRSDWHNTPTVRGIVQRDGHLFRARHARHHADATHAEFAMDLASAYPASAGLESWHRTLRLIRGHEFSVIENYAFATDTAPAFELNLLTPRTVKLSAPGRLEFHAAGQTTIVLDYPPAALFPELDTRALDAPRMRQVWGTSLTRVRLVAPAPAVRGKLTLTFFTAKAAN